MESVCRWFRRTHKSTSEKSYSFCLLHHFYLSFYFRLESDLLVQESKIVETENKTQVLNASIHR